MFYKIRLTLSVCALVGFPSTAVRCAEAPFSITISAAPDVVRAGSDVRLNIMFTNTSEHEIRLITVVGGKEFFNLVQVLSDRGAAVPTTRHGRDLMGVSSTPEVLPQRRSYFPRDFSGGLSLIGSPIAPGKTRDDDIVVSALYDLSRPGKYTVQVNRFDETTNAFVKSNKITITVTE